MQIGFDLDKVFINTPPLIPDVLIDKIYKKKSNGVLLYRIPSLPDQLLRRITHLSFLRPAMKKNMAFLKSLPKKNTNLYLISSRYKFLEGPTNRLIKYHGLDKVFDKLYFNFENKQPHEFKNEVLKQLKLDMYIDDDLALLKYVARDNPKTRFFWLNHRENQEVLPKNIYAIRDLSDIFKDVSPAKQ